MGMCERLGCAVLLAEGRSSPPHCSPFLWFWLEMGIFALMCLGNDIEILHINLYVFGSWVREKGEGVRTRKSSWNKKL
jgi:hypothetical protein